jgi:hypothetical protein
MSARKKDVWANGNAWPRPSHRIDIPADAVKLRLTPKECELILHKKYQTYDRSRIVNAGTTVAREIQ